MGGWLVGWLVNGWMGMGCEVIGWVDATVDGEGSGWMATRLDGWIGGCWMYY